VLHNGEKISAYLDPELRILSTTAPRADCEIYRFHYLQLSTEDSVWLLIDSQTGSARRLPPNSVTELFESLEKDAFNDFHPIIFHKWALSNDSDQLPFPHVGEMMRFEEFASRSEQQQHARVEALGAIKGGVPSLLSNWFWELLDRLKHWWIYASCSYASFLFIRDVALPMTMAYLLNPVIVTFRALVG